MSRRNADSVVEHSDGSLVFIEPHETLEPFKQFLEGVQESSRRAKEDNQIVKYAQTRTQSPMRACHLENALTATQKTTICATSTRAFILMFRKTSHSRV